MKRIMFAGVVLTAALFFAAAAGAQAVPAGQRNIILATTTSTQDSGLLDVLIPLFEKKTGYFVKTIAVGSGQAMMMGQKGEADVLLVHSPLAEETYMAGGYGAGRRLVMHNDFVIVGPAADPARIKGLKSSNMAFKRIAAAQALFMSRGDNSGTDAKEKALWKIAGITPKGQKWYQQTGLGMGQTLNVAIEKQAYTLSDRGTYLALKKSARPCPACGGRQGPAQHLSRDRGQPGKVAQGECRRRKGLRRLHGVAGNSRRRQDVRGR